MLAVIECMIIIIGMNVVDNLNSVYVINKPCMSSRRMSLLPWATLHSDSEHTVSSIFHMGSNYATWSCSMVAAGQTGAGGGNRINTDSPPL